MRLRMFTRIKSQKLPETEFNVCDVGKQPISPVKIYRQLYIYIYREREKEKVGVNVQLKTMPYLKVIIWLYICIIFLLVQREKKVDILKWIGSQRDLFIFNYSFCSFLNVFLPSRYLQRIFDNFDWFLVDIETTVLIGFSVIDLQQVLLLSFSFFTFFFFFFFLFFQCVGVFLWVYFFFY